MPLTSSVMRQSISNFRLYCCSKKIQMLRKNVKLLLEQLQVCIFAEIVFGVRCTLKSFSCSLIPTWLAMALTQARFYSIVQFYCFQDFTMFSFIVTRTVSSMYICLGSLMISEKYYWKVLSDRNYDWNVCYY